MRLVVQRVARASVRTGDEELGEIAAGALALVGFGSADTGTTVDRVAEKLVNLRFFADEHGHTNRSILDIGGAMLVVSQFTLYADVRRGRRPGFTDAATPETALLLLDRFVERVRGAGVHVETGRFGAEMAVELVNDGPFTLVIDSDRDVR